MPKITRHPRLQTRVRKGARGQRWVYYFYDMRPEGKTDIPLGTDHAVALAKWDELYNKKPRMIGRIQEAIVRWREEVLVGTRENPSPYTNAETIKSYTRHLAKIEAWCGQMPWHEMTLPLMRQYLKMRTGKTQANRELAVLSIVWSFARKEGITSLTWPAAGMERSGWKNTERARTFEVTDEVFAAIYAQGDQILRDAMDIASATGMRLTDVRTVPLPPGDQLRLDAKKTGKKADFDISLSAVLPDVIRRRRANKRAMHLRLLASPTGRAVSLRMLQDRFSKAREAAAKATTDHALAASIRAMILRDCRKYASDQAGSLEEASQLLQHSSQALTAKHYRTKATQLKPVR